MKPFVLKGATDQTVYLFIQDSSSTTGAGLTGLAYNTASLVCYYVRPLGSATAITLATQTVTGAHSDGGFVEVSSSNMPGWYRLDLPDAVCASGVNSVGLQLKGATNMAPVNLEIPLTAINLQDSVRMGLTSLPNAAADAAGGLPISDAGGLDMDAILSRIGTPSNLGGGATISANLSDIESQTDDIGAAGAGLTAIPDSAGVTTLLTRIPSALFSGITSLAQWLGLIAGKQTGNSTARTEIRATGAGSGTYDETTDSQEAIRDAAVDAATLVDSIWDEATSGHSTAGTTGKALTDAGSAGDPWSTALPGAYSAGTAGKIVGDNLNATVGSRLPTASYTAPLDAAGTRTAVGLASANLDTQLAALPTAGENAGAVWEEAIADHSGTTGSTAEALNSAGSAGDPWTTAIPGAYGAGSAGYILGNRVDAAISTRATPAQVNTEADTALSDVGLTTTITGRIDAAISTRLASASYSAPPSAATIASQVRTELTTELARIDVAVSTRLATAGYTVPLDASGTRSALGMSSANMDTQLAALDTLLDTAIANIAALNNISTAQVLTQVNSALDTAISELGVGAPTATPSLRTGLMLLYMALRNRGTTTATAQTIQNDAGTTIATATLSDDATTYTKSEFA